MVRVGKSPVRRAELRDLPYIEHLCSGNFEAIGFLPTSRYESVVLRTGDQFRPGDRLWVAEADDDLVGFVYATVGRDGGSAKIVQLAIQDDARRLQFGQALADEVERHASATQRQGVSCRVAADLEATVFWNALGYDLTRIERGGERRQRQIQRRHKRLPCGLLVESYQT